MHDPLSILIADLVHEEMVRQVDLGPLATEEASTLLRALLAERSGNAEEMIERVLARAGGVPFFLISCVRAFQAGVLTADEGAKTLPWDLQQTIRQRVAALPAVAQELLLAAAVAGRVIPGEVLVAAATRPEREVLMALAWEQGSKVPASEVLAYHYSQAGELAVALGHLMRAAERARVAGAHREEAGLLLQAIAFAEQTGQQQLALDLRMQRGNAFWGATLWAEAKAELTSVLTSLSAEHETQRTEVLTTLAEVHHWLLDVPGTRRYAGKAFQLAERIGRDDLAARAMTALALAESSDGQTQASLEHVRRAIARAGDAHLTELASGVMLSGMLQYWLGHFQDAIQSSRQALDLARRSYDTSSMVQALGNLGLSLSSKGRYAEAFETFEEARRVAHERGTGQWLARVLAMCGGVHLELFDSGAEALAQEAREVSRSVHWPLAETSAGIDLLLNFARRGEVGRAERLVDEVAQTVVTSQGAHGWLWRLRFATAKGELALARGAWDEAARVAEEVIVQGRRLGRVKYQARGLEIQAQALAALGRVQEAMVLLHSAVNLVRTRGDPVMFLRAACALLSLSDDDVLFVEAQARAQAIVQALPDEDLIRRFLRAEAMRPLMS